MSSLPAQYKATLLGLLAILLWSSVVGLIRSVSEGLGPIGGAAMIYSVSAVFLLLALRMPNLRLFPRPYLLLGSLLFVSYEICLSLSLGYANTRAQQSAELFVGFWRRGYLGAVLQSDQENCPGP